MSRIAEFRAAERALAEQIAYLESLKHDAALKSELEFEEKLKALMGEYSKTLSDIISILDPDAAVYSRKGAGKLAPKQRRLRVVKVYKNPHNNEVVETKGGNNKVLKAWKSEYGAEAVESWLQP